MNINGNFNIGYNNENTLVSEALVNYSMFQEGYLYPIDDLEFKTEDFHKFIELLNEQFTDIKVYDFSDSKRNVFTQYKHNLFIIHANGNSKEIYISVNSKDIDTSKKIFNLFKKFHKDDNEVKIYITSYFMDSGRVNNLGKTLAKEEIESISDSYYPYIDNDIMYKQFFTLQENILILAGKPGIGKSKMASSILKYAVNNENILPYDKTKDNFNEKQFVSVGYVKSNDVLADDSFWRDLEQKEFDFVILDDLDYFLTTRDSEVTSNEDASKNKFLNQFLSFTDGIEKHKTKFIITTNQPYDDLDIALLRKGRLFDILELRDLSFDEALVIWEENNLEFNKFQELYDGQDRVLPADLGSEIAKHKNTRIDESLNCYLLEDDISKIKEAKLDKNVGF